MVTDLDTVYADNQPIIQQNESMIQISAKQYAEAIMAIQKLADIKSVAWTSHYDNGNNDVSVTILLAIRSIVGELGDQYYSKSR